jgi:hypothetical protein
MTEDSSKRPAILVIDDHEEIKRLPLRDLAWHFQCSDLASWCWRSPTRLVNLKSLEIGP